MKLNNKYLGILGALALATGCGGTGNSNPDPLPDNTPDAGNEQPAGFQQPANTVAVNFTIDASGRPGFYSDGDLEWKGAFEYDSATRIQIPDGNWDGPFAPLYDDGPWTAGGHEPKGSVAGDDKFGVTVFMAVPTEDQRYEYGAQTKAGGWIWPAGDNGAFILVANSTAEVTADGLTLTPEGTYDLRLTLDTKNLGSGATFTAGNPITVKGTFSEWSEDPAFDDGTHGDATANDGVFTYTLSANAVRHLKLTSGTIQEWVWVIYGVDADGKATKAEYKTSSNIAEQTGVAAFTKGPTDADFTSATISLAGNGNTMIVIP